MANPTSTNLSPCEVEVEQFFLNNMSAVKTLFEVPKRPRWSQVINTTCREDDGTESVRDLCSLVVQLGDQLQTTSSSSSSSECPPFCELLMTSAAYLHRINMGLIESNRPLLGPFFYGTTQCICGRRCENPDVRAPDTTNQVYMSFFEASVIYWHRQHQTKR